MRRAPVCDREHDVLELAASSGWPYRAEQDLRDHVGSCPVCHDLAVVIAAITDISTDTAATPAPRLPDPRLIWHRAQMRARQDAARRAARPLVIAERTAIAVAATVLLVWFSGSADVMQETATGAWQVLRDAGARLQDVAGAVSASFAPTDVVGSSLSGRIALAVGVGLALFGAAFGVARMADRTDRS